MALSGNQKTQLAPSGVARGRRTFVEKEHDVILWTSEVFLEPAFANEALTQPEFASEALVKPSFVSESIDGSV